MKKVTVYSTTTCRYCKQVKDDLAQLGQDYTEVLLDQEPERIAEAVAVCNSRGVPCTKVEHDDGGVHGVLGYDPDALKAALA